VQANMTVELIVHFMRNHASEHEDDCIRISKLGPNFLVTSLILVNDLEATRMRTAAVMSHHGVTRFVQDVFALVALDCIPFQSVQVSAPLAPSVLFDISTGFFEKARETLVRLVDTSLTHWPEIVKDSPCKGQKRRRVD
jgi:hypothetical protein